MGKCITIKEIKEKFIVERIDHNIKDSRISYLIRDKDETSGRLTPHKFLCSLSCSCGLVGIVKKNKDEIVYYDDIEKLYEEIIKYVNVELKYNSEFFDPRFREGYADELCVIDYIINDGYKFVNSTNMSKNEMSIYSKVIKNIYGGDLLKIDLTFIGLGTYGGLDENVEIILEINNNSYLKSVVLRDVEVIIAEISNIVTPLLIHGASTIFNEYEKKIFMKTDSVINHNNKIVHTKEVLIEKLEDMLRTLKQQ